MHGGRHPRVSVAADVPKMPPKAQKKRERKKRTIANMLDSQKKLASWRRAAWHRSNSRDQRLASSNPCASIKVRVGMAKCAEEERVRGLDVSLEYVCVGAGGEEGERKARMYRV